MMGPIINKIREEQVNCILIGPNWPRSWMAVLQHMARAIWHACSQEVSGVASQR